MTNDFFDGVTDYDEEFSPLETDLSKGMLRQSDSDAHDYARTAFQRWKSRCEENPRYRIQVENEVALMEYQGRNFFNPVPEDNGWTEAVDFDYDEGYPRNYDHLRDDEYAKEAPPLPCEVTLVESEEVDYSKYANERFEALLKTGEEIRKKAFNEAFFSRDLDFNPSSLEQVEIELTNVPHPTKSALAEQVGGDHYKSCGIQPLEYAYANGLDVCEHAIVKYITRHKKKGQVQDLEKVIHYARLEAKLVYGVDI